MNPILDNALKQLYLEFDTPADRVLANPELAEQFFTRISDRMGMSLQKETVFSRLLNLRKNGDLPRLRRN